MACAVRSVSICLIVTFLSVRVKGNSTWMRNCKDISLLFIFIVEGNIEPRSTLSHNILSGSHLQNRGWPGHVLSFRKTSSRRVNKPERSRSSTNHHSSTLDHIPETEKRWFITETLSSAEAPAGYPNKNSNKSTRARFHFPSPQPPNDTKRDLCGGESH